jgi:hypothetical protein
MPGKTGRDDVLNAGGAFLMSYGSVAFCCFLFLAQRWAHMAPTSPDPRQGYVYAHNEHGWITYFSAFQATSCALLFATSLPLAFIGIFITPKKNIVYRRGTLSVGAKWDADDPQGFQRVGFILGAVAAPLLIFLVGPGLVRALIAAGVTFSLG